MRLQGSTESQRRGAQVGAEAKYMGKGTNRRMLVKDWHKTHKIEMGRCEMWTKATRKILDTEAGLW